MDANSRQKIRRSGLFDDTFYRNTYLAEGATTDPWDDYLRTGASLNRNPHPLFDTEYYLRTNPEVAASGIYVLSHYLTRGGLLSPHPLFDARYYLERAQVHEADAPLLQHYLANWSVHRIAPHPLFDVRFYLERYPDVLGSERDPLSHYLTMGAAAGYKPHPLFDTVFYYRRYPDVKAAGVNALVHYVLAGGKEGRSPNAWFDSVYYLQMNRDVARAGLNPLVHYVLAGAEEGRAPHALFRPAHWAAIRGLEPGIDVMAQFLEETERPGVHAIATMQLRPRPSCRPEELEGSPGANLIGWPRMENGVAEQMREMARSLDTVGVPFSVRDISWMRPSDPGDDSINGWMQDDCPHRINLHMINADNMTESCERLGFENIAYRFNIASWAWELSDFPDVWRHDMSVLDEIWSVSTFVQRAVSLKAEVPVLCMPPAVTLPPITPVPRSEFGIREDSLVFLFQFDFSGFVERKNPYAAIAAFRQAFPDRRLPVSLVIKVNNTSRYPEKMRELQEAAGRDRDVILIDQSFRRDRVVALLQAADVFVSLHRAEGFGRSLAEAMLLGKPVIATNYSGNTDFMTPANSCPVQYSLVPVKPGEYPHAEGQVWAEPDIDHAASYMRRLATDDQYRSAIGAAASKTLAEHYNSRVTGERYRRRLQILGLL